MPNHRHPADQTVTLPTKPAIPICILNDAVICRVNYGQHQVVGIPDHDGEPDLVSPAWRPEL